MIDDDDEEGPQCCKSVTIVSEDISKLSKLTLFFVILGNTKSPYSLDSTIL
jgi:hypothetical protein